MRYLEEDIWFLTCPRDLDAPAPDDWTVVFKRDETGTIVSVVMVVCWQGMSNSLGYERCLNFYLYSKIAMNQLQKSRAKRAKTFSISCKL